MTHEQALMFWSLLGSVAVLVGIAAALLLREAAVRDLRSRVEVVGAGWRGQPAIPIDQRDRSHGSLGVIAAVGRWLRRSRFYSSSDIDVLESIVAAAGFDPRRAVPLVLGGKLLFLVLSVAVAIGLGFATEASAGRRLILAGIALPIGVMGPEFLLKMLRRSHASALRRGVPDALDLLVVCTEAGLGLESALDEVSTEMRASNPAMAAALARLLDELKVLPDRRQAFLNFGQRSGVEGIRRMATVLAQTLQLGTPLGHALRVMAVELRRDRMVALEAKAIRLPALLVFPLIFCILPTLLITLVGPSALYLIDTLHSVSTKFGH